MQSLLTCQYFLLKKSAIMSNATASMLIRTQVARQAVVQMPMPSGPLAMNWEPDLDEPDTHEYLARAFDDAIVPMALIGVDSSWLAVNEAFCRFLGYTRDELLSHPLLRIVHPDDIEEDRRQRALLLAGMQRSYRREMRCLHKDQRVLWGDFSCTLARDESGHPLLALVQVLDITERKLAEHALRDSERRFSSLVALSSDWYWEQDAQLRFTTSLGGESGCWRADVHRGGRKMLDSAIGKCRWELDGVHPLSSTWDEHKAALRAHKPFRDFEYMRATPGRDPLYISASGEPVFGSDGEFAGYRGIARDVTQRKLAEQRACDMQALLHTAEQLGRLGAWAFDVSDSKVTWSTETCTIHEVTPGYCPSPEQAMDFFAAEHRERVCAAICSCLHDGSPFDLEAEIVTAKGRRLWVRMMCEAEWDEKGAVRRLQGALQDISESKRVQEEILRLNGELSRRVQERTAQLEAANKELEAFSYSIAHDLRAPLAAIGGFSRILEEGQVTLEPKRNQHYLARIRACVRQMSELSDGLLALAKLSRSGLLCEPVDLAEMARAAVAACQDSTGERAVRVSIAPRLPAVGDPRLLSQVIGNLVGNAWKFTSKRCDAQIEVGVLHAAAGAGDVFFVRDNGAGFDMAFASRMFEPFQRLHAASDFEGTGIGLAIVHKIVRRHGGLIWAEAAPERGATFFFTLCCPPANELSA